MHSDAADIYLDRITLGGVSTIAVDQGGGAFAFVQRSKMVNRSFQLHAGEFPVKVTRRRLWMLDDIPSGLVWCSGCGDFHLPSEFSPDKRVKKQAETLAGVRLSGVKKSEKEGSVKFDNQKTGYKIGLDQAACRPSGMGAAQKTASRIHAPSY